ncbi:hypothetical protein ACFL6S_01630 [Candidatus Poribacteria bacterium]
MKRILSNWLLIVIIPIAGCAAMQNDWEAVQSINTIVAYEQFLTRYPEGEFANQARVKVKALYFQKAKEINTISSYEDFLERYPTGKFADQVHIELEALHLQEAKDANTISSYQGFLERYPIGKSADQVQIELEALYLQEARDANTISSYEDFLKQYPTGEFADQARIELETLHLQEARDVNTILSYEGFLKQYPVGKLADQARTELETLHLQEAKNKNTIDGYREFLEKYPDHAEGHYLLGVMYERKGYEFDEEEAIFGPSDPTFLSKAVKEYEEALALKPDFQDTSKALQGCKARIHHAQGTIYINEDEPDLAIREFRLGIEADPNNYSGLAASIHNAIGSLHNTKTLFNKAVTEFEKALKFDPASEMILYNLYYSRALMWIFDTDDLDNAEKSVRAAIEIAPDESKPRALLGLIYGRRAYRDGTVAESKESVAELEKCIAEFKQVLERDPDDTFANEALKLAYVILADYYGKTREWDKGLKVAEEGKAAFPQYTSIRYKLAVYFFITSLELGGTKKAELLEKATAEIKEVLKLDPDYEEAKGLLEEIESMNAEQPGNSEDER